MAGAVEPMMYVGIKVVLKDNSVLPIYVSKEKAILPFTSAAQAWQTQEFLTAILR